MKKELCTVLKAYLAILSGLALAALVGQPYSLGIATSALLVVIRGQSASPYQLRRYIGRRVLVYIVVGAILPFPLLWLSARLSFEFWKTSLLVQALVLPLLFYLDRRFSLAPMPIITISMASLVLALGIHQDVWYSLKRIGIIVAGCMLGYVVSQLLFPRDGKRECEESVRAWLARLAECAEAAERGDWEAVHSLLPVCRENERVARAALAAAFPAADQWAAEATRWLDDLTLPYAALACWKGDGSTGEGAFDGELRQGELGKILRELESIPMKSENGEEMQAALHALRRESAARIALSAVKN